MNKIQWRESHGQYHAQVGLLSLSVRDNGAMSRGTPFGYYVTVSGGGSSAKATKPFKTVDDAKAAAINIARKQVALMEEMLKDEDTQS